MSLARKTERCSDNQIYQKIFHNKVSRIVLIKKKNNIK